MVVGEAIGRAIERMLRVVEQLRREKERISYDFEMLTQQRAVSHQTPPRALQRRCFRTSRSRGAARAVAAGRARRGGTTPLMPGGRRLQTVVLISIRGVPC